MYNAKRLKIGLFPVGKPVYDATMNPRKQCEHCGNEFQPLRNTARFCCDTCRTLHHLEAKRREERAANPDKPRRNRHPAPPVESEAERLERLRRAVDRLPRREG